MKGIIKRWPRIPWVQTTSSRFATMLAMEVLDAFVVSIGIVPTIVDILYIAFTSSWMKCIVRPFSPSY